MNDRALQVVEELRALAAMSREKAQAPKLLTESTTAHGIDAIYLTGKFEAYELATQMIEHKFSLADTDAGN